MGYPPTVLDKLKLTMVEIRPIHVHVELEEDGRLLASVPDLPGVMAYGSNERGSHSKSESGSASGAR